MPSLDPVLQIIFLAFLVEGLVEYLARPLLSWGQNEPEPAPPAGTSPRLLPTEKPLWLRYIAVAIGILVAVAFGVDLLALAGLQAFSPWVGWILTGILIGRGSNYLHDLVDRWLAGPQAGA